MYTPIDCKNCSHRTPYSVKGFLSGPPKGYGSTIGRHLKEKLLVYFCTDCGECHSQLLYYLDGWKTRIQWADGNGEIIR